MKINNIKNDRVYCYNKLHYSIKAFLDIVLSKHWELAKQGDLSKLIDIQEVENMFAAQSPKKKWSKEKMLSFFWLWVIEKLDINDYFKIAEQLQSHRENLKIENNMKNKTLNENKYFNSGLYDEDAFYKHHEFSSDLLHDEEALISYNREKLFTVWYYLNDLEEVDYRVWDGLDYENPYEPKVFNEDIAIECGLIPFIYDRSDGCLSLLVGWQGNDSRPRLDAYQLFTAGTIDKKSSFFLNKEYFIKESSKGIMDKMDAILKGGN